MFSLFCVDADCLLGWADTGMSASRISHWGLLPHRRPIRDRATAVSQNKPDQTGVLGSVDSRNYGDIPRQSRPEHTSTACWRKQGYSTFKYLYVRAQAYLCEPCLQLVGLLDA